MSHVLSVPRWAGSAETDFQSALRAGLEGRATVETVVLPNPPVISDVLHQLGPVLAALPPGSVLVGHSVGVQALLRTLAHLRLPAPVAGLVAVAGWVTVDKPWPSILPWVQEPWDREAIRRAVAPGRFHVLLSDNDPFTADHVATRQAFEDLGASVRVLPARAHFNDRAAYTDVLAVLLPLLG